MVITGSRIHIHLADVAALKLVLHNSVGNAVTVQESHAGLTAELGVVDLDHGIEGQSAFIKVIFCVGRNANTCPVTVELGVDGVGAVETIGSDQIKCGIHGNDVVLVVTGNGVLEGLVGIVVTNNGGEAQTKAVLFVVSLSVVAYFSGSQSSVVETNAVKVSCPCTLGVIVTDGQGICNVGVLGYASACLNTVDVNDANGAVLSVHVESDCNGRANAVTLKCCCAVVNQRTVSVFVVVLVLQVVSVLVLLGNADEERELVVIGAHQGDPVGCLEVQIACGELNGVRIAVDQVNNCLGEIIGCGIHVEGVVLPVVSLVHANVEVVFVAGEVSPKGSVIVLLTVGVVCTVVPSNQTVFYDLGLSCGRGSEAEACEAAKDHGSDNCQGKVASHDFRNLLN